MRILVTGSAGHLGRALLPALAHHPAVETVTGLDRHPTPFTHPRFRGLTGDLAGPAPLPVTGPHDALIHLAFIVQRGDLGRQRHDRRLMTETNRTMAERAVDLARTTGARQLLFLSSAAVYGAWPDNPPRLREDAPLRPNPGFGYAEDKAAVEALLSDRLTNTGTTLTILRPPAILGPDAQPILRRLLAQRWAVRLPEPPPLTQCVWQDDVARAVVTALERQSPGIYNLAAEPAMSLNAMKRHIHPRLYPLPHGLMRGLHRAIWRVTGRVGEPSWMEALGHSLVLDTQRARSELDWTPIRDVPACLAGMRAQLDGSVP